MPTRILSFQQVVLEADPNWQYLSRNPRVYEFSNGRWFNDSNPTYQSLPGTNLFNDSGLLILTDGSGYPTSSTGLPAGAVWNNNLAISVVPGAIAPAVTPAFFTFPGIIASQLLLFGGYLLATTPQTVGSGLLWNDGGLVAVA